jgi:hypothetical protein
MKMTPQKGEDVIVHGIMDDYGVLEAVTAKAYLISFGHNKSEGFWIPISQCDFRVSDRGWEAEASDWFAEKVETIAIKQMA